MRARAPSQSGSIGRPGSSRSTSSGAWSDGTGGPLRASRSISASTIRPASSSATAAGGRSASRGSCGTCRRGSPTRRSGRSRRAVPGSRPPGPGPAGPGRRLAPARRRASRRARPPASQTSSSVGATLRSPPRINVSARWRGLLDPARQPREPGQLALVERRPDDPPVGCVQAHDPQPVHRRGDHPRLVERVEVVLAGRLGAGAAGPRIADRPVAEVRDHVRDRQPIAGRDGHPVPAALAVVDELVAGHREGHDRRVRVGQLGLLDEQDVRCRAGQPVLDGLLAGLQRVDVPGRDAHLREGTRSVSA